MVSSNARPTAAVKASAAHFHNMEDAGLEYTLPGAPCVILDHIGTHTNFLMVAINYQNCLMNKRLHYLLGSNAINQHITTVK